MNPGRAAASAPELPAFELPTSIPAPGGAEPELAVAAPATSRPFHLGGERAFVLGTEAGSIAEIRCGGVRVVTEVGGAVGVVANTVLSPGRIRRERLGPHGSAIETILVAPTLPLVAVHWTSFDSGSLSLQPLPDAPNVRVRVDGRVATFAAEGVDEVLAVALHGGSGEWQVEHGPDGRTVATVAPGSRSVTLLVAYGQPRAVSGALRAAGHLATHERAAVAAAAGDIMTMRSGSETLDDACSWMQHRTRHGILNARAISTESGSPASHEGAAPVWGLPAALWAGLGAAATGDEAAALRCVKFLSDSGARNAAGLMAGRVALSTGQVDAALRLAEGFLADGNPPAGPMSDPTSRPSSPDAVLHALARNTLADALRYRAAEDVLERLRSAVPSAPVDASVNGPGPRLPVVGSGRQTDMRPDLTAVARWLEAALRGVAYPLDKETPEPYTEFLAGTSVLHAWSRFSQDPDAGWALWRAAVDAGAGTRGPHGSAAWDDPTRGGMPAITGILLATMTHGWLGCSSDAPSGRLGLAPRIPSHVEHFEVADIPLGDSRVRMRYHRDGGGHHFEVEATRGRVPPLLVFEPSVPGRVERIVIDGEPAEAQMLAGATHSIVRLQTPLDPLRRVMIETD